MSAIKVWGIEDSGPLIRIDWRDLPDLDAVLLEAMTRMYEIDPETFDSAIWEDDATRFALGSYPPEREARVGWFRTNPCACGMDHKFDMEDLGEDEPTGSKRRGAFLGVWFL